jgi:uracil-DNA glycosylase family 4
MLKGDSVRPDGPCCHDCPHRKEGARFIPPDGTGASGILVVGDSPWRDEQRVGKPFAGAAGHTLDRSLALIGLQRVDLSIWNTIQCPPLHLGWTDYPNRFPAAATAIEHCKPHLDGFIADRKPRVIVPMGNVALRRICGISGIDEVANYVLPTPYGIPAVPTFHPSFIMQGNHKLTPSVLFAFKRAQEIASGNYEPSKYELLIDPPADTVRAYVNSVDRISSLFVDIETPESGRLDEEDIEGEGSSFNIIRCGFSVRANSSVTFPWCQPYISILQSALDRSDEFVEWADNRFDSRRIAAAGLRIPQRIVSGMWVWHWLQSDLRKGLGKVAPFWYGGPPWKSLNAAEPAFYNAMDVAIGRACYEGSKEALCNQ